MAKSATGKWVSRVGSSGGGKAYKKSRPGNYYGILVVIVVLGLVATVLARYDYQHPGKKAKGAPPAIGTTWYAGLSVQACGKYLPYLPADPTSTGGLTIRAANVVRISPVSSADAGNNATLAQFANEYPGMVASSTQLTIPGGSKSSAATTYRNGSTCAKSSKYPGQTGQIEYAYWTSFGQKTPVITTNPSSIKLSEEMRVVMAFDPKGVTPMLPQQITVNNMVKDVASASTTTTTTTTTASTTTTAAPGATTTTKATTTTTKG